MEDVLREPVELIDEDLDEVAGGQGVTQPPPPPPPGPHIQVVHQSIMQSGSHNQTATLVSFISQP